MLFSGIILIDTIKFRIISLYKYFSLNYNLYDDLNYNGLYHRKHPCKYAIMKYERKKHMIEILCVIWLLNQNGKIALARGQNPSKYRIITIGLWFGLEVLGTIAGTYIALTFAPNSKPLMIAYVFGITGALLGAFLSRMIVNRAPLGNYKPQDMFQATGNAANNISYGYGNPNQTTNTAQNVMSRPLSSPATIRLVDEYYWNENSQDMFFLNGLPICTLRPGTEYMFATLTEKNVFTVGQPYLPKEDTEHCIRFIASENGKIEIVVKDGKIMTDQFKNFKN